MRHLTIVAAMFVLLVLGTAYAQRGSASTTVFERRYPLPQTLIPIGTTTIDCEVRVTQVATVDRGDESAILRVSTVASGTQGALRLTFTNIEADEAQMIGNAGSTSVSVLQTARTTVTLIEVNGLGFPFIYNVDRITGVLISTKAYADPAGAYSHVAVGTCTPRSLPIGE